MRGDPILGREPEEEEFVIHTFGLRVGSRSGPDGSSLAVVTEDGRELRIVGVRHPRGAGMWTRPEIVVSEEDA